MEGQAVSILANVGLFSFLALSAYVLLIGGEMSFGQQAFFGIGAYAAGMATAMGTLPLGVALFGAIVLGALAASGVGLITLRLRGLYFSMATLTMAEAVRIFFELFIWRIETAGGDLIGPNGSDGFGGIRYQFEHGVTAVEFVTLIYALLLVVLLGLFVLERMRVGVALRMVGSDPELAAVFGINADRLKLVAAGVAGGIAALGGGLFAHYSTYIEPRNFDVMLGVHSMAYALIGGLGTSIGPLLGVTADIALLESSRAFHGYRMIAFGGLVALFLIVRPRGLLDERAVHRIQLEARRLFARPTLHGKPIVRHLPAAATTAIGVILVLALSGGAMRAHAAQAMSADIECRPTNAPLVYDCTVLLHEKRSGVPIPNARFAVGTDMPSMPMAHNVKAVTAEPTDEPGKYRALLTLEMYGTWAVKLMITSPVRDQITKTIEFQKSP